MNEILDVNYLSILARLLNTKYSSFETTLIYIENNKISLLIKLYNNYKIYEIKIIINN